MQIDRLAVLATLAGFARASRTSLPRRAEGILLVCECNPEPPFPGGSPETAGPEIVEEVHRGASRTSSPEPGRCGSAGMAVSLLAGRVRSIPEDIARDLPFASRLLSLWLAATGDLPLKAS